MRILFILFIGLISALFINCEFSPTNSIYLPPNDYHDVPLDGTFKIEVELKDENNDDILLSEDDDLFDEIECILNNTLPLYKYVNEDKKLVCVHLCGIPEIGETVIDIMHDNVSIKQYRIGIATGIKDDSRTVIYYSSPLFYVGSETHFNVKLFDTYGIPIHVQKNDEHYNKYICTSSVGPMYKYTTTTGNIGCKLYNNQTQVEGSYYVKVEYEVSPGNLQTLGYEEFYLTASGHWSPELSVVNFPSVLYKFSQATITLVDSRDEYNNPNFHTLSDNFHIKLYSTSGSKLWESSSISGLPSGQYKYYIPASGSSGSIPVKIRFCQGTDICKESGTVYWI